MSEQGINLNERMEYHYNNNDRIHQIYDKKLDVFYPCTDIEMGITRDRIIFQDIYSARKFLLFRDKYDDIDFSAGLFVIETVYTPYV